MVVRWWGQVFALAITLIMCNACPLVISITHNLLIPITSKLNVKEALVIRLVINIKSITNRKNMVPCKIDLYQK